MRQPVYAGKSSEMLVLSESDNVAQVQSVHCSLFSKVFVFLLNQERPADAACEQGAMRTAKWNALIERIRTIVATVSRFTSARVY